MKIILVGLLLLSTISLASTKGIVEIEKYESIKDTSFIRISGDAAKLIWNDMKLVDIMSANQFQPNDMKVGDGVSCEKSPGIDSVSCTIKMSSSEGIVEGAQ